LILFHLFFQSTQSFFDFVHHRYISGIPTPPRPHVSKGYTTPRRPHKMQPPYLPPPPSGSQPRKISHSPELPFPATAADLPGPVYWENPTIERPFPLLRCATVGYPHHRPLSNRIMHTPRGIVEIREVDGTITPAEILYPVYPDDRATYSRPKPHDIIRDDDRGYSRPRIPDNRGGFYRDTPSRIRCQTSWPIESWPVDDYEVEEKRRIAIAKRFGRGMWDVNWGRIDPASWDPRMASCRGFAPNYDTPLLPTRRKLRDTEQDKHPVSPPAPDQNEVHREVRTHMWVQERLRAVQEASLYVEPAREEESSRSPLIPSPDQRMPDIPAPAPVPVDVPAPVLEVEGGRRQRRKKPKKRPDWQIPPKGSKARGQALMR